VASLSTVLQRASDVLVADALVALRRALDDRDEEVRRLAGNALKHIGE
jgi:HEAT repeat protein